MRTFVGIILMLLGLLFGAYIGIYEMLYKGILLIVEGINADPNNGSQIAMGILRIILAQVVGGISAFVFAIPGFSLFASKR